MVMEEFILRAHTDKGMRLIEKIEDLITKELKVDVSIIDHRTYNPSEFGVTEWRKKFKTIISLDKHLAEFFGVDYFQISRIFKDNGDVHSRRLGGYDGYRTYPYNGYHIIDTDMVHGDSINLACKIFATHSFNVPILVEEGQDLIDMEDLFMDNSLLKTDSGIIGCNYLLNREFFTKRTSLPEFMYDPIREIIIHANSN
jgi:hypothetical protein